MTRCPDSRQAAAEEPQAAAGPGDARGRVAALDPGTVRVGVAWSDPEARMAFPRGVLPRHPEARLLEAVAELVASGDVRLLVVGLPLHVGGERGERARDAERLASRLAARLPIPVVLHDERFTTADAEEMLIGADLSRRRRRQVRDKVSAALLLESFLRERKGGG